MTLQRYIKNDYLLSLIIINNYAICFFRETKLWGSSFNIPLLIENNYKKIINTDLNFNLVNLNTVYNYSSLIILVLLSV